MILLIILASVFVGYILLLGFTATVANFLIFPAPRATYAKNDKLIYIDMPDGRKIAAVYRPAENAQYCIIYSHGNREDIGTISKLMDEYNAKGYAVLAYDYIGYGHSQKDFPTPDKLLAAADAVYAYAKEELEFKDEKIVAIGYSLGSAAAAKMAQNHPNLRALILIGGFASIPLAILPFNPLPWKILCNADILKNKNCAPVLLLHGTKDITVAPRNARINFKSSKMPARLVWLEGYAHKGLFKSKSYWDEIERIIKQNDYEKSTCITVR